MSFNRPLSKFSGKAVVLGCSHRKGYCSTGLHQGSDSFYTIDSFALSEPDFCFDMGQDLPQGLKNKFQLTLLEGLPYNAFNVYERGFMAPQDRRTPEESQRGFSNAWDMTEDNGFILIVGCSREKEFRKSLHEHKLKYIELDSNDTVLIPKNQNLDIQGVRENINKLEAPYKRLIQKVATMHQNEEVKSLRDDEGLISTFVFSELSYENIPTTREQFQADQRARRGEEEKKKEVKLSLAPEPLPEEEGIDPELLSSVKKILNHYRDHAFFKSKDRVNNVIDCLRL